MITLFRRISKRALTQSAGPGTQADIRIAGISLISRIKLEGVPHADAAQISALCTGFENTLTEDDRKAFLEHLAVALNRLDITLALLPQPHDKASARVACLLTLSVFLSTFALSFKHVSARCCIQRLLGMTLRSQPQVRPLLHACAALLSFVTSTDALRRASLCSCGLKHLTHPIPASTLAGIMRLLADAVRSPVPNANRCQADILMALESFITEPHVLLLAQQNLWYQPVDPGFAPIDSKGSTTFFEPVDLLLPSGTGLQRREQALQWSASCFAFLNALMRLCARTPTVYTTLEVIYRHNDAALPDRSLNFLGLTWDLPPEMPHGTTTLLRNAASRASRAVERHPQLLSYFIDSTSQSAFIPENLTGLPTALWCEPLAMRGLLQRALDSIPPSQRLNTHPYLIRRTNPVTLRQEQGIVIRQQPIGQALRHDIRVALKSRQVQLAAQAVSAAMARKVTSRLKGLS